MDDLIGRLEALEHHVRTLEQQNTSALRRLRWWRRLAYTVALLTVFSLPLTLGAAQDERKAGKPKDDQKETLKGLLQRFLAIERKLEHVTSVIGPEGFPELVITGANLRIVNGLEVTEQPNGTGNLIVGYNEPRLPNFVELVGPDDRTGSHNVVVGAGLNFGKEYRRPRGGSKQHDQRNILRQHGERKHGTRELWDRHRGTIQRCYRECILDGDRRGSQPGLRFWRDRLRGQP